MRIAVINQCSSPGGGARFVRALVRALATTYADDLSITLFADQPGIERDSLGVLFADMANVTVRPLSSKATPKTREVPPARGVKGAIRAVLKRIKPVVWLYYELLARQQSISHRNEHLFELDEKAVREASEHDLVYLAWPYFIEPTEFGPPLAITMHDFNFMYPFGNFSKSVVAILERQLEGWITQNPKIILSSRFMESELRKFHPNFYHDTKVVHLPQFIITATSPDQQQRILSKFGIPESYMVSPANAAQHKNPEALLRAVGRLKRRGIREPLVLIGDGTEKIGTCEGVTSPANHPMHRYRMLGAIIKDEGLTLGEDVIPLGYVSDEEADTLIRNADMVVSASLYEAGSGPAVDAWHAGTTVAFSNIPPFLEQLGVLGTKAWVFDPHNPDDIANVLERALSDKERCRTMAEESLAAIGRRTWNDVAREYFEAFRQAIDRKPF